MPTRDELEQKLARAIAKANSGKVAELLRHLGDNPSMTNIPPSFWNTLSADLQNAIEPYIEAGYLQSADDLMQRSSIGVSWDQINQQAADWASRYTFDLVKDINNNTMRGLQRGINWYYQSDRTIGDLERRLSRWFSPQRAEMIAITEVTRASSEGQQQAKNDILADNDSLRAVDIWQTSNDELVCPICGPRHNREINDGVYPPAHPRCLPGNSFVLPIGGVSAGSKRWYEGNLVTIETLENKLSVTPNHPILTRFGWVPAGKLKQGQEIVGYAAGEWKSNLFNIDNQNRISMIEDVFGSLDVNGFRVPTSTPDFHGDGGNSDVAIIRTNSEVMNDVETEITEPITQDNFVRRNVVVEIPFSFLGAHNKFIKRNASSPRSFMSRRNLTFSLGGAHSTPFDGFGFGLSSRFYTGRNNSSPKDASTYPNLFSELIFGFPGNITLQNIVKVGYSYFSGHVYNLQTESGLYVSDGIITHNCRCSHVTRFKLVRK